MEVSAIALSVLVSRLVVSISLITILIVLGFSRVRGCLSRAEDRCGESGMSRALRACVRRA